MVLAAGAGRRLESLTEDLPKTLLPVDGDRTILDIALGNLRRAGMETVVVVTGYAAERIEERREALEQRHEVAVETVFNPKAEEWNNCYSLWCAREHFARGVLLCNGDTVHPPEVEERLLAGRGHAELVLALDDAKTLGEEEMKVLLERRRAAARDQQGARPGRGGGRVHRADADRAGGVGRGWPRRSQATWRARPAAVLRGRLPGVRRPRRARRRGVGGRPRVGRGRRPARPGQGAGGGVALLSRMVGAPLTIDIGPGAVAGLAPLLADRRISSGGHVGDRGRARAGRGDRRGAAPAARERRHLDGRGRHRSRPPPSCAGACAPASSTPWSGSAAARRSTPPSTPPRCPGCRWSRSPPRSPTTGSPRRCRRWRRAGARRASACRCRSRSSIDLDYVRASDASMRRSGIGDVVSNLGAIADWWLAARERAEPVDGLAVTFARTAATSVLHREDGIDDDDFLIALAEALVLSGPGDGRPRAPRARARAPTTRSSTRSTTCIPAPRTTASSRASAACSHPGCAGDDKMARDIDACLTRHGLPRTPADLGLDARAVRRGGRRCAGDAARSLHDPRAPRPLGGGGGRPRPRVRRGLRSLSCGPSRSRRGSSSATRASTGRASSTSAATRSI